MPVRLASSRLAPGVEHGLVDAAAGGAGGLGHGRDGVPGAGAALDQPADLAAEVAHLVEAGTSTRDAVTAVAEATGTPRRSVYQAVLEARGEPG